MESTMITYTERPDGLLYPDMTTPESSKPLGKYGLMLQSHLQQNRPVLYNLMLMEGTLSAFLEQRDEQAHEMVTDLEAQLRAKNPPPRTTDFWELVRYNPSMRDQAEEAVLLGLLEMPE